MITLSSDRLRVEIAEPGVSPNNKTRFDRAGYISDVILDGGIYFAASEPRNLVHPCSGGRGFCNEFRFDASAEAAIGEYFPKLGVGLIRKEEDKKYIFHRAYKDVLPYPIEYSCTANQAVFVTSPIPCLGYAVRTTKTITVEGNSITTKITLENVGNKEITVNEFCHNFISIDGMAVGSDYELTSPRFPEIKKERLNNRRGFSGSMRGIGRGISFCEFTAIDTDYAVLGCDLEQTVPFTWRMIHKGARAYVEGEDYFIPKFVSIWGVDHIMSPEIIHEFTVKPGGEHSWKRVLRFNTYYREVN